MAPTTVVRAALSTTLLTAAAFSLAACTTPATPGASSPEQVCPDGGLTEIHALDITGSTQAEAAKGSSLELVDRAARRAAQCEGYVKVFAFASSTGTTASLYDGTLTVDAPTENAKRRKADKLADEAMGEISKHYDSARMEIAGVGTDVLGMLTLFEQAAAQHPAGEIHAALYTDGNTNIGVDPAAAASPEEARALADAQTVPDLSAMSLSVYGIGQHTLVEQSSETIANVTAFWDQICQNTGATACTVVTDGR